MRPGCDSRHTRRVRLGSYDILEEIGRGGMGTVHRARASDGTFVAIKVIHSGARTALDRFERERRLLGQLGAEAGFVPLLDSGEGPRGPWIAMPFLRGGTLRDRLARGPFPVA